MLRTALIALALTAGTTAAVAANFPCEKFGRNADGTWGAKEPVQIFGPNGRLDFTPGEVYKKGETKAGLDTAQLLEANCAKK
jgi:hypothetical protein